jgi:hypothetical protein
VKKSLKKFRSSNGLAFILFHSSSCYSNLDEISGHVKLKGETRNAKRDVAGIPLKS